MGTRFENASCSDIPNSPGALAMLEQGHVLRLNCESAWGRGYGQVTKTQNILIPTGPSWAGSKFPFLDYASDRRGGPRATFRFEGLQPQRTQVTGDRPSIKGHAAPRLAVQQHRTTTQLHPQHTWHPASKKPTSNSPISLSPRPKEPTSLNESVPKLRSMSTNSQNTSMARNTSKNRTSSSKSCKKNLCSTSPMSIIKAEMRSLEHRWQRPSEWSRYQRHRSQVRSLISFKLAKIHQWSNDDLTTAIYLLDESGPVRLSYRINQLTMTKVPPTSKYVPHYASNPNYG
jgi:hypothetical protein